MNWGDYFVGGLAMVLGMLATASALGISDSAFQLRTVRAVHTRFGDSAARLFFVVLAIVMFSSGAAIIAGLRPLGYGRSIPSAAGP